MKDLHKYEHEAMKTVFSLSIIEGDPVLARDSVRSAIQLLDQIENCLSRYIEGSDVWQINHMKTGQSIFISELSYDCIRLGLEAREQTGGLFDITLGRQIEHQKSREDSPQPELAGLLQIDPARPRVHCLEAGREIDLGGIGKGYALDCMAARLKEWGIRAALLSAGSSTQLAFGEKAWQIQLEGESSNQVVQLKNQAISASGTRIQGAHILYPGSDGQRPQPHACVRVLDDSATAADVWSTATMLMTKEEINALIEGGAEILLDGV